jgi:hypothetical protein
MSWERFEPVILVSACVSFTPYDFYDPQLGSNVIKTEYNEIR